MHAAQLHGAGTAHGALRVLHLARLRHNFLLLRLVLLHLAAAGRQHLDGQAVTVAHLGIIKRQLFKPEGCSVT